MGEIADAMLEGTLCEACGAYIDGAAPGHPRYCCKACEPAGAKSATPKRKRKRGKRGTGGGVTKRDIQWLRAAASHPLIGYNGVKWEEAVGPLNRLLKSGLVMRWTPHNPIHKDRALITAQGKAYLEAIDKGEAKKDE